MDDSDLKNFALTRGSEAAKAATLLRRKYKEMLFVASPEPEVESDFLWGVRDTLRKVIADFDVLLHDEDQ